MKLTKVPLTKRATLILLELERKQLWHPIMLADGIAQKPPLPEGMSHEQAIAVPGDYKSAFEVYEITNRAYTNAAVIGWASKPDNVFNFGDDDIPRKDLLYAEEQMEELFEAYGSHDIKWTGNEIVDRGLRIISIADGISGMNSDASRGLNEFLNGVYGRFGITDDAAVGEKVKSEGGDGSRNAGAGSGEPDQAGTPAPKVRAKRLARGRVLGE